MNVVVRKSQFSRLKNTISIFLEDFESTGICRAWVDEEIQDGKIQVWVALNLNYIEKAPERGAAQRLAQMIRNIVKERIKNSLGIYVEIGSIAERC